MQQEFTRKRTGVMAAACAVQREMDGIGVAIGPRDAVVLIALGDQHFDRFSEEEMNILFNHLHEAAERDPGYDQDDWALLQVYLRGLRVYISKFPEYLEGCLVPRHSHLFNLFHRLWTSSRAGYRKIDWKVFRKQLNIRGISV